MKAAQAWMEAHPCLHTALLALYYLAIIGGLALIYGRGDFSTPPFVYQEF